MKQEKIYSKMEPIVDLIWASEDETEFEPACITVSCISDSCGVPGFGWGRDMNVTHC